MTQPWHPDLIREQFAPEPTPARTADPFRGDPFRESTGGWGETALANEVAILESTAPGGINDQINTSAFNLGQIIAGGGLDLQTCWGALYQAAATASAGDTAGGWIEATLRSGFTSGQKIPRIAPERKDVPAWPTSSTTSAGPSTRSPAPWEDTVAAGPTTDATATSSPAGTAAPAASTGSTDTATPSPEEDPATAHLRRLTTQELYTQRARRDARRILDDEEALAAFRVPPWRPTLTDELAMPDEPISYLVEQVFPTGANVLLIAQFKAGKTTLVNALTRALADGEPFLERFDVADIDGRVALFNYEVDDRQYRRWLRDIGIRNTDKVVVLNLRGYRMPVTVPHVEDWIVAWLVNRDVKVWCVDPFARAFTGSGTSENDNTEVGRFLDTLDVIKNRAGVGELILPTHTGRAVFEQGEERARGATRLDDWADVRWMLNKDADDVRFLRATGRDVEVPEEKLTFNEATRSLAFGGGDRAWEKRRRITDAVVAAIAETPGINTTRLRTVVREKVEKAGNDTITSAIEYAISKRLIHLLTDGSGAAVRHYPGGAA